MTVRLALASAYLPDWVKRRELRRLLVRSAAAFGVPPPRVPGRRYREWLLAFATFTAEQASAPRGDVEAAGIRSHLRRAAYATGRDLGRWLGIRGRADAMKAARLAYRMLGIDFEGLPDGSIVIRRCDFSHVYTPRACALMSALDEGLLAGLAGEGRLKFESRITEGCDRCTATFRFREAQP